MTVASGYFSSLFYDYVSTELPSFVAQDGLITLVHVQIDRLTKLWN